MDKDVKDILDKYQVKLKENIKMIEDYSPDDNYSLDYRTFREESLTRTLTSYESSCNFFERLLKGKVKDKEREELSKSIETSHLQITPEGGASFAFFIISFLVLFSILLGIYLYLVNRIELALIPMLLILISFLLLRPLTNIPNIIAARWRLRASNQMVLCILYIVMYMRHTSNLEHAIKFASDHIGNPLSLDFRKVFWDIETGRFSNIKQSLDNYLQSWRDYNLEFVEAFHLIQGSLYESSEDRRVTLLEKALEVMLNGTYEKMLHYAHELKEPITILHMLGVILPILGLVILPLFGSLLQGSSFVKIIVLLVMYNLILTIMVYLIGINILAKSPTGYSESDLIAENPELSKYKNIIINLRNREVQISPFFVSFLIFFVVSLIGIIPLLVNIFSVPDFPLLGLNFFDYKADNGLVCNVNKPCYGPFGFGAVILGLFFPLGIALGIGTYYRIRSRKLIVIRNETKKLELEFAGSLFQLGNRIGDGVPVEVGFGDVAANMSNTPTGDFFRKVSINIQRLGLSVKEAIFNKKNGAIWDYPSSLIESSMKVLLESSRKGPLVVSKSLISISTYIDRIHQVNERLKDLLAEVISSMKSQISFLTPIIAGIVIGIATMIVTILGKLTAQLSETAITPGGETGATGGAATGFTALIELFQIQNIIPSYYLQLIVGLYLVEIVIVLTILANGIENGADNLAKEHSLGKNLYRSSLLYVLVAFFITIIFTLLATNLSLGVT